MSLLKKFFSSIKKILNLKKKSRRRSGGRVLRRKKKKASRKKLKKVKVVPAKKPSLKLKAKKIPPQPKVPAARAKKEIKKPEVKKAEDYGELIGPATHYFNRIRVIVLKITNGKIALGDKIRIKGASTDFVQSVRSLQIESVNVKSAKKGQVIGLQVDKEAKVGDKVFKLPN